MTRIGMTRSNQQKGGCTPQPSDLYHIPGDTGKAHRVDKFLEYAIGAPTICHPTIIAYAKNHHWGEGEIVTASFLHCLFYEELTAISGVSRFGTDILPAINWYDSHTPHTNPDKRRVVTMNQYPEAIQGWSRLTQGKPKEWMAQIQDRAELRKQLFSVKNIGGFSIDLFENCAYAAGYNLGERYPEWNKTPQLAEGMYLICYRDERAQEIHAGSTVTKEDVAWLDKKFEKLCDRMNRKHPGNPPEVWYTKLCSFTNLFHGSRYGGYHHDRQLENLHWHMEHEPYDQNIWDEVFDIRKELWRNNLLGELHGWNGIRKERKKLWLEKGLTGVEYDS